MILVNTPILYLVLWLRIGVLCVSFGNGVTIPPTSLLFLVEVLVKALGFSKLLQLFKINI